MNRMPGARTSVRKASRPTGARASARIKITRIPGERTSVRIGTIDRYQKKSGLKSALHDELRFHPVPKSHEKPREV